MTHSETPTEPMAPDATAKPSVTLVPFAKADFQSWFDHCTEEYAKDKQKSFGCTLEAARAFAQSSMQSALADGLQTKDNHLFKIKDEKGASIGVIWIAVQTQFNQKSAFIYDIEIDDAERGKGYGRAAMKALEAEVAKMGLASIGLHVFAFNERAFALYQSLGFEITDYTMRKKIQPQK